MFCTRKKTFFLLLFDCTISLIIGVEYGPSLDYLIQLNTKLKTESNSRKEIYLEGYYPSYSVAIPLTNGSSSATVAKVRPNGDFSVVAPISYGLMVVVQALRLRTHVVYSDSDDTTYLKCRDYLRFTSANQTSQVCGHVMKYSKAGHPSGLLGPRTFITADRQLTISLSVDANLADHDYGWDEMIATEIVITAFKECPKNTFMSQWKKLTGGSTLRSCSPSEDKICIYSGTFCDGMGNCGVKGPLGHIGYDEENCGVPPSTDSAIRHVPRPQPTPSSSTTAKPPYIGMNKPYSPPASGKVISPLHLILIFSVIVLVLFGACTCLAKANEKKFQHTMYRFSTIRRNRRNINQRSQSISDDNILRRPSAPPDTTTPSSDVEALEIPGEQPPPYHDLFPSAPPLTLSTLS